MMMDTREISAIVPVKEFDAAKRRLSNHYSPPFRRGLARAMLEDVLNALTCARALRRLVVVTVDAEATRIAARYRTCISTEGARDGHTGAVMAAIHRLAEHGRSGVLAIPADVPGVTPDEVSRLLAVHRPGRAFSIVPAHDHRGSNAIVVTPPDAVPLAFGDDSFVPHCERARQCGIEPTIIPMQGLALDIDNELDLVEFMKAPSPTRTWAFLAELGMVEPFQARCEPTAERTP